MLKLFCVVVGHEGSPFSVNVPADETVDDLKKKINDEMKRLPAASELQLYRVDGLSQDDNEQIVYNGTTIDMPNCSLVDFGSSTKKMAALSWISESFIEADVNIRWKIHLLVVVPSVQDQSSKSSDAEPLLKKVKITQPYVVCQGPVGVDFYSVPMETIPAYRKLSALYSAEGAQLCMLYGPRQFGKTTIGCRIQDSFANDTSVFVVYHSATELSVATEEAFWMALGQLCGEVASTPQELMKIIIRRKQRLFLIVDEMDGMFVNSVLTSHFLDILREWLRSPHFRGFLGIGSYDLVSLYKHHKGNDRVSPFNLATIVKSDRFSADQMIAFFKLIEPRYPFTDSTRYAIMEYSGGAPGVFGSLIQFSIDNVKWKVERHQWETWLKITTFFEYLEKYNFTYSRIRDDLQKLSTEAWKTLEALLMNGASIHRSSVGADILLRMGIVFEGTDSTVVFSSEMMRRVCLEALPIRDIKQALCSDNPFELFAAALQFLKPKTITHYLVTNRQSPSEAVFQFELYSSIRGILTSNNETRHILAEAGECDDRRRLDIIICNGVKYGFELKSNQLTATTITAAVKQADGYRTLLAIDKMFMINFVPQSHSMDEICQVDKFPYVEIIHVRFPESCTIYEMRFQGLSKIESRFVSCI